MPSSIQTVILLVLLILPGYVTVRVSFRIHSSRKLWWNEILFPSIGFGFILTLGALAVFKDRILPLIDLAADPSSSHIQSKVIDAVIGVWPVVVTLIASAVPLGIVWGFIRRTDILGITVNWISNKFSKHDLGTIIPMEKTAEVWDSVFACPDPQWVRVRMGDEIIEGYIKEASSYPHPKQIFLTEVTAYEVDGIQIKNRFPKGLLGVLIKDDGIKMIEIYEE